MIVSLVEVHAPSRANPVPSPGRGHTGIAALSTLSFPHNALARALERVWSPRRRDMGDQVSDVRPIEQPAAWPWRHGAQTTMEDNDLARSRVLATQIAPAHRVACATSPICDSGERSASRMRHMGDSARGSVRWQERRRHPAPRGRHEGGASATAWLQAVVERGDAVPPLASGIGDFACLTMAEGPHRVPSAGSRRAPGRFGREDGTAPGSVRSLRLEKSTA